MRFKCFVRIKSFVIMPPAHPDNSKMVITA